MPEKLKIEVPTQGWKQLLTSRKEMLDAYDRARKQARAHEVEIFHGKVAEAKLRDWLSGFLPKRFGVTPGYVVSPGLKSSDKLPHFDVIVYDQLESPGLWIEESPDISPQGRSMAIPAEHVRCILEVKARFSSTTSGEAIEHLGDLLPLMGGFDDRNDRYKLHLPPVFCCGLVFFDLSQEHQFSKSALNKIVSGIDLRGFFGGVILRGEGCRKDVTGKLTLLNSATPITSTIGKGKESLFQSPMSDSVEIADGRHCGATLTWAEYNFSQFGFDVIAMMQGTYQVGRLSSFYGMGTSEQEQSQS